MCILTRVLGFLWAGESTVVLRMIRTSVSCEVADGSLLRCYLKNSQVMLRTLNIIRPRPVWPLTIREVI